MNEKLRVVIADDERPARSFLAAILRTFEDVEVVGEASNGMEAVEQIETKRPDLALLDLQMPEIDGLGVVRLLRKNRTPLIAFVTAYDQYAVRAFEMNAVDYVLKPVEAARLRQTIERARERLEREDYRDEETDRVRKAADDYESGARMPLLQRIPVRRRDAIVLLPVQDIASVTADGELLHLRTKADENHTICYRLRDLASRLEPAQFIRLGRGTLVNIEMILRIVPMPGGTFTVVLKNNHEFRVSRIQSRFLRTAPQTLSSSYDPVPWISLQTVRRRLPIVRVDRFPV
jgi:two-component system LytT family response regulator